MNEAIEAAIRAGAWGFGAAEWHGVSAEARAVVSQLLAPDAALRLDAPGLLAVPWVAGDAPHAPLPSATAERLAHFNSDRGVWRAALHAVSLLSLIHI